MRRKRNRPTTRTVTIGVAVLATALPALAATPAAVGGGPTLQERDRSSFVDSDFCGTGKPVAVDETVVANVWIGTTGGDPNQVVKLALNRQVTYTNPANGSVVSEHWAFSETNEIVAGLESGPHTHMFVSNGLKAMFRLAGGGVLTRDAGSIGYVVSFDADDNITGIEALWTRGPHPSFPSFDFCGMVGSALGL